uniref:Unknown protein 10 (Fragments) n=1 Tax=Pseudotsuga menziesii TaxID=3357 RepID=UP10_PSEMZ|nr:RecName: Full=Unknown protein 10 [Pseudotsuga menziesii]
ARTGFGVLKPAMQGYPGLVLPR